MKRLVGMSNKSSQSAVGSRQSTAKGKGKKLLIWQTSLIGN